jgi:hypothetical protein
MNLLAALNESCLICVSVELRFYGCRVLAFALYAPSAFSWTRFGAKRGVIDEVRRLRCVVFGQLGARVTAHRDGLQAEGVFSCRNHIQCDWRPILLFMQVTGLKPSAQSCVEDLGVVLPEIRFQTALDAKVAYLQLDGRDVLREVCLNVLHADVKSSNSALFALCLDQHTYLP